MELREFAGESLEGALEKAGRHFGVPPERLSVSVLSDRMLISGIGARVLVLAGVREGPEEPAKPRAPEPAEEFVGTVELGPVGEFFRGLLERIKLQEPFQIVEAESEGQVLLRARGASVRAFVRRDRRLPGAMTHLVTRAAEKILGPGTRVRLDLGVDDARGHSVQPDRRDERDDGREGRLEAMAVSRAEEAKSQGQEVLLPPMNSRERWVVHNALKGVSGIVSESVGEGRLKRVKIIPA
ncbi:MAG: R3H domain-containing nucleic acid-binding protein [Myxococcota bacterium]